MPRIVAALAVVLFAAASVSAAEPASPPDRAAILDAARDVMQKAGYCALITVGDESQPQARVVDPFPPESDFSVWIGTKPVTRKVAQIRRNKRVTLFYFDQKSLGYVTLIGTAELVTDPAEKAKHWKEGWSGFYADKNHGDDYLLIHVRPVRLELVSYAHGITGDPKSWRPVELDLK